MLWRARFTVESAVDDTVNWLSGSGALAEYCALEQGQDHRFLRVQPWRCGAAVGRVTWERQSAERASR